MKWHNFLAFLFAGIFIFPLTAQSQTGVNGYNVTSVSYSQGGSVMDGSFVWVSAGAWQEYTVSGSLLNFKETNRDDWSVYLVDQSRDITIQLDLFRKEVIIFWDRPNRGKLYTIIKSEARTSDITPVKGPPAGYSKCADENGTYYISGKADVAYGAEGSYYYKYGVSGSVTFNNATFGDPAPGLFKSGYFKMISSMPDDIPEPADFFDGVSPVSANDMGLVMKWIADNVSDASIAYCYKQSYGRGVGEVLTSCPPGTEQNGALCYPLCAQGYSGAGPVCWQHCPPGFRNDPAHCGKPAAYGRGAGYPWKFGDALNLDAARRRCQSENPQGCEKYGEIIYPKCREGFYAFECCVCSPKCPNGMRDIGVSCEKKSYGRGVGSSLQCRAGLEQDGGLCYPACKPGYYGVGPVCWQRCTGNQSVDCGAGCAKSSLDCAKSTLDMITAVAELAANIVSLGTTSKFTAAKAVLKTAIKAGDRVAARIALKQTAKALAEGFERLTTRIVLDKLKEKFTSNAIKWVAFEYAKVQLRLTMQQEFSVEDLRDLAGLDPTGIAGVVEAFWKPVCVKSIPFPALSRNYY